MKNFDTIEETIKFAVFGRKKVVRKQIELFEENLPEGEKLLGVGFEKKPVNQIYITNKRVTFFRIKGIFANEKNSILIKDITAIDYATSFGYGKITINAGSVSEEIEKLPLHIANELISIIEQLRDGIN